MQPVGPSCCLFIYNAQLIMNIHEQARRVLQIAAGCRFPIEIVIWLYIIQGNDDAAESYIKLLSDGGIDPNLIRAEMEVFEARLDQSLRLAFQHQEESLRHAVRAQMGVSESKAYSIQ